MDLSNAKIILTGASSGIGLELLKNLVLYSNVKIIAVARNINTIPSIEGVVFPFSADLSTQNGVDSVFEYAKFILGEIDIFISNAGFGYCETITNADWKHIENIFGLNVFSPIYSLEKLIESGRYSKVFVSIISAGAFVSLPYYSLYCSTKAALHSFMNNYRNECKIQLMNVYPVATRTSFFAKASRQTKAKIPLFSQDVNVVVKAIIRGLENDKKNVYPSFLFRCIYPIGRMFPVLLTIYLRLERKRITF